MVFKEATKCQEQLNEKEIKLKEKCVEQRSKLKEKLAYAKKK